MSKEVARAAAKSRKENPPGLRLALASWRARLGPARVAGPLPSDLGHLNNLDYGETHGIMPMGVWLHDRCSIEDLCCVGHTLCTPHVGGMRERPLGRAPEGLVVSVEGL